MSDQPHQDYTEHTLDSTTVYRGKLLHVMLDTVRLADSSVSKREYIRHPGAVMVLAFSDERTIVLERQFRYAVDQHLIELPAGKLEAGEDPLEAAQRELREECGYVAGSWKHLNTIHPCVGYADERIEFYLARDLRQVGRLLDDGEFLDVLHVPVADAVTWIREGRITDVKALMGILWAEKIVRGDWDA